MTWNTLQYNAGAPEASFSYSFMCLSCCDAPSIYMLIIAGNDLPTSKHALPHPSRSCCRFTRSYQGIDSITRAGLGTTFHNRKRSRSMAWRHSFPDADTARLWYCWFLLSAPTYYLVISQSVPGVDSHDPAVLLKGQNPCGKPTSGLAGHFLQHHRHTGSSERQLEHGQASS